MTSEVFRSSREFEVWRYTVSHRQLLLRSNKTDTRATRLEVLFKDVAYMAVPPLMQGLVIDCASDFEDLPAFMRAMSPSETWYRIATNGVPGFVAAGAFAATEDDLAYFDASALLQGSEL